MFGATFRSVLHLGHVWGYILVRATFRARATLRCRTDVHKNTLGIKLNTVCAYVSLVTMENTFSNLATAYAENIQRRLSGRLVAADLPGKIHCSRFKCAPARNYLNNGHLPGEA